MRGPFPTFLATAAIALALAGCGDRADLPVSAGTGPDPALPPPDGSLIPTVDIAPATGWPRGEAPTAAEGLQVAAFADGLNHPRWLYVLPNGDVLVAESNAPPKPEAYEGVRGWVEKLIKKRAGAESVSADRITLLRDADGDGVVDRRTIFLDELYSPFGMALIGDTLYVANTDAVVRFPYHKGQTRIVAAPEKLLDLPAGPINQHWTRNLIASPDGSRLYVAVGSASNAAEHGIEKEIGRAAVWEVDPETGEHRIFASGLRNPVGMDWEPESGALWVAVNERDELGGDLVPDYMTAVKRNAFYGWPYSYFGDHVDERVEPQRPDLVSKAVIPDYALGAHTASLGLAFAEGARLTDRFSAGAFIGQHGSWNRDPPSGYKVVFVPFENGRPAGKPIDVLTGFLGPDGNARGRPVGVAVDAQGALLVADDVGNRVWRVTAEPSRSSNTEQDSRPGRHRDPT